jgi:hypothetical protein
MVHCESMLELGGPLQLLERPSGLMELNNQTAHDLMNVAVVRRRRGRVQFAGLPLLRAGATMRIEFRDVEPDQIVTEWQRMNGAITRRADEFEINGFQQLAANPERIHEGDVKMFAWSDAMLPGLNIEPPASQQTFLNLWIVNLRYGQLPAPRSDINTPDYRPEVPEDTDDRID